MQSGLPAMMAFHATRPWTGGSDVVLEVAIYGNDGVPHVPTFAGGEATGVIGVVDARTMECLAGLRPPQIVPFGFHAAFRPA